MVARRAGTRRRSVGCVCCDPASSGPFSLSRATGLCGAHEGDLYGSDEDEGTGPLAPVSHEAPSAPPLQEPRSAEQPHHLLNARLRTALAWRATAVGVLGLSLCVFALRRRPR